MDKIEIFSGINAKAGPDLKKVEQKAVAGVSNAELIERHTIGEIQQEDEDGGESDSA